MNSEQSYLGSKLGERELVILMASLMSLQAFGITQCYQRLVLWPMNWEHSEMMTICHWQLLFGAGILLFPRVR